MSVLQVTDAQIARLHRREWVPDEPGHIHGQTLWAMWNGKAASFGLQPGCKAVSDEIRATEPELTALVEGLTMPAVSDILRRGMAAFGRWAAAGLPVVSEETRQQRAAACTACPRWDGLARGGLGHCKHPGCGCTRLKWWLRTERCPDGRWPA